MRYGVLSDVHSNLPALKAVLAALEEEGVDEYLCLGDIVGYGPFPNECCEILAELGARCVRGNHDEAAINPSKELWFTSAALTCIRWTRDVLTDANRLFLAGLEPRYIGEHFVLCHGSIPDPDFYTTSPRDALLSFRVLAQQLAFFGHTHYAEWFEYDPTRQRLPSLRPSPDGDKVLLREGVQYMVNPGSVGQPRDRRSSAAFAILDLEEGSFELKRVPYNIAETQQAILEAGLPEAMARRLSVGM
ncbi:MAG: metallophosphoesterase family protein [Armatimonadetes bacterium]|nr:metallophosphoesterase family protein [Armatimonadota bacterium]